MYLDPTANELCLLWSACRHHVGELIIGQIFTDLKIEVSRSPEVTVFLRLKKNWEMLPQTDALLSGLDFNSFREDAFIATCHGLTS